MKINVVVSFSDLNATNSLSGSTFDSLVQHLLRTEAREMREQQLKDSQNKHKSIYYAEILTVVYFLDSGVSFLGERVRYELQRQVEAKTAAKAKIRAYHSNFRHNILKGVNGIRAIWGVSMKIIIDINAT